MKIKDMYHNYLKYCELKMKPQSLRSIKSRFNTYILPYIGKYDIDDFKRQNFKTFKHLTKKPRHLGFFMLIIILIYSIFNSSRKKSASF